MFDEIIDFMSTVFTLTVIVVIICVVVGILKGIKESEERAERMRREQEEQQKLIKQIEADTKVFPTNVLISQREEVWQAYNVLYDCKQRGSIQTKELLLFFRVGDKLGCSMDLKTCDIVLDILNDEIERRNKL